MNHWTLLGAGTCAVIGLATLSDTAVEAQARAVYLCENESRAFAVAGTAAAPPGCREIADPEGELLLSPAQPDIEALSRELAALSERVAQLELMLLRRAPTATPLAPPAPRPDRFGTRGRTRDLGQDIQRRLDGIGR